MNPFRRKQAASPASRIEPRLDTPARPALKISRHGMTMTGPALPPSQPFRMPQPAPGVIPADVKLAQDDGFTQLYSYAQQQAIGDAGFFPGFPYLAELAQRAEFRRAAEIIAREMTRKWIRFEARGDDDKSDKIAAIEAAMDQFNVKGAFRRMAELDSFFGRGHLFVDTGLSHEDLALPLVVSPKVIRKGDLKALRVVEPMWVYPNDYNSDDPLSPDWYRPRTWYVQGRPVHRSRLLTFVSRAMPDILKPAYTFAGLSLTQMGKPYVDNWLRTRQSVSDMLHSFSVSGIKTNLGAVMTGGGSEDMILRAQMFNQMRDNRGVLMIDKDTEEFFNVSAPLSTLDHLQAQSQEQMCSVWGIPLVFFTGITPSGLNASSDGEIRVFYGTAAAMQEALFKDHLDTVIDLIQLNEFGEIDPDITYSFEPLWQLDEAGEAAVRKTDADTDIEYINAGVLAPIEVRQRIARAVGSAYTNIDVDDLPEAPGGEGGEINDPDANRLDERAENQGGETSGV